METSTLLMPHITELVKMNSDGRTLTVFGDLGKGNGKFTEPSDLVLDNRGHLFVLDSSIRIGAKICYSYCDANRGGFTSRTA